MDMRQAVDILLVECPPNDAKLNVKTLKTNRLKRCIVHVYGGEAALNFRLCPPPYTARHAIVKPEPILPGHTLPNGALAVPGHVPHDCLVEECQDRTLLAELDKGFAN